MQRTLVEATALAIKHFRKANGLSQEELADRAQLDRTYISGIERGVRNITLESLDQLIIALGISHANFFKFVTRSDENNVSN